MKQKKAKREEVELKDLQLKELMDFHGKVTKMLAEPVSDGEDENRVGLGHLKRTLRVAARAVDKVTPEKFKPLATKKKKAAVVPKPLQLEDEEKMDGVDSDAESDTKTPYEVLKEQLGLSTVKKTVADKKKTTTKISTPMNRMNINLVKSLDGAAQ